nr:immunoglobulin heavy chain junction region [Macaca mulatta]MOV39523.1 immunoglobulin heavy chain junction region [Macaca mulatta]MOV40991.1 immunoglobulin heavy chain junction region [Macaca mulatta]MOV41022.1 immunoglobulin heavy chain junction region [Macaca mulatta]MOV41330.1 immunoglobulin heavy chain junction region [Macaca mulatta]
CAGGSSGWPYYYALDSW